MHVVIIAFSALHAARRESFSVFAAVYALYFFPWRLIREKFGSEKIRSAATSMKKSDAISSAVALCDGRAT